MLHPLSLPAGYTYCSVCGSNVYLTGWSGRKEVIKATPAESNNSFTGKERSPSAVSAYGRLTGGEEILPVSLMIEVSLKYILY